MYDTHTQKKKKYNNITQYFWMKNQNQNYYLLDNIILCKVNNLIHQ